MIRKLQVEIEKAHAGTEALLVIRSHYWRFRQCLEACGFRRQILEDAMYM